MADTLGDYIKGLERNETDRRALPGEAVYVRIDGNRFSKFTKGMHRPFDINMSKCMTHTTMALVEDYHALIGFTQSDEISLIFWRPEGQLPHDGKLQKLVSRCASKATATFLLEAQKFLPSYVDKQTPEFDARAFPCSLEDAIKAIHWRVIDAKKNAVTMAARTFFSHKELQNRNTDEMKGMMKFYAGVEFDEEYPSFFRHGLFVRRETVTRFLTPSELEKIPEKHRPIEPVQRSVVMIKAEWPDFTTITNKLEVVRDDAKPVTRKESRVAA